MWPGLAEHWQQATAQAWQAYCAGSLPIGAIVATQDGAILSSGHNTIKLEADKATDQPINNHPLAHAEINALLAADWSAQSSRKRVLYTTTEPCPLCFGAAVIANVKAIHYASRDPWAGSSDLVDANRYIRCQQLMIRGPEDERLEKVLVVLQIEAHLTRNEQRARGVLATWREILPQSVQAGQVMYKSQQLRQLAGDGAPVADAFELILETIRD